MKAEIWRQRLGSEVLVEFFFIFEGVFLDVNDARWGCVEIDETADFQRQADKTMKGWQGHRWKIKNSR